MSRVYLQWIGQSGYRIWDAETEILLDPYLSNSVEQSFGRQRLLPIQPHPEELNPSVIVCTHDHLDHLDPDTLMQIPNKEVPILAPGSCKEKLQNMCYVNLKVFEPGTSLSVGSFTLTCVPAVHTVDAVGVVIRHGKLSLYFTGDTFFEQQLCNPKTHDCDVLFVCINGKLGNMGIEDAVELTNMINPSIAVPNHYGMFASNTADPAEYASSVPNCQILQPYTIYFIEKQQEAAICSVT